MGSDSKKALENINLGLSIVSNVIGIGVPLLGLLLGIIQLKPGYGLLSKPGPLLALTYLAMVLGWLWLGLTALKVVKRRYAITPSEKWRSTFATMMYVITVPFTVLWILAFGELLGWPKSGASSTSADADTAFTLMLFGGGTLLLGGGVIAHVAVAIDWFFNPSAYTADP